MNKNVKNENAALVQRENSVNENKEDFSADSIEFLSVSQSDVENSSEFVPVKLKPEEAKRIYEYQKAMLTFALSEYKKSIGTSKEAIMGKMYKDAIYDYKLFESHHKDNLS